MTKAILIFDIPNTVSVDGCLDPVTPLVYLLPFAESGTFACLLVVSN
jgi:hypothetical protein